MIRKLIQSQRIHLLLLRASCSGLLIVYVSHCLVTPNRWYLPRHIVCFTPPPWKSHFHQTLLTSSPAISSQSSPESVLQMSPAAAPPQQVLQMAFPMILVFAPWVQSTGMQSRLLPSWLTDPRLWPCDAVALRVRRQHDPVMRFFTCPSPTRPASSSVHLSR